MTWFNNVSVALVVAGVAGPIVATGFGSTSTPQNATTVVSGSIWLLTGFILHLIGRLILTGLRP
jgi:hypothetical protein